MICVCKTYKPFISSSKPAPLHKLKLTAELLYCVTKASNKTKCPSIFCTTENPLSNNQWEHKKQKNENRQTGRSSQLNYTFRDD